MKIQFKIKSKQKVFFSDLWVTIQVKCSIPYTAADTLVMAVVSLSLLFSHEFQFKIKLKQKHKKIK